MLEAERLDGEESPLVFLARTKGGDAGGLRWGRHAWSSSSYLILPGSRRWLQRTTLVVVGDAGMT